jgi:hypothetical protein
VAYVFNIFANWRRIPSPKVMENKIQVLRYTGRGGSTTISMNDALHVRGAVNSATRFRKRVRAWFASNPFRAGLPGFLGGRTYYETLYVPIPNLASEHASTGVRTMMLKPGLDMISRVKELRQDGVYIVARGGSSVSFYVVVTKRENPITVSGTVAVPTKDGGRYYVLNQGCKVLPNLEPPRDNGPAGIQIA